MTKIYNLHGGAKLSEFDQQVPISTKLTAVITAVTSQMMTTLVAGSYERFWFAYEVTPSGNEVASRSAPHSRNIVAKINYWNKSPIFTILQVQDLSRAFSFPAHKVWVVVLDLKQHPHPMD